MSCAIVGPGSGGTGLRDIVDGKSNTELTGVSPLARNPVPARDNTSSILTATVNNTDDQSFRIELQRLRTSR